ncbi:hypothetical protein VIGAN_11154000 [Vigna angularis var. angularis]|uniref:RRM domain-containing protein n=1 Tax=Vigna angularis var. angularis TaxID=157739 RepID=A0A0S3TA57_PHAAN|nr:hypothetical protein VIGAN_11154000 [Vigna angularis var. angularis]
MTDGYWNRQQALLPHSGMLKRPRSEYDMPASGLSSGNEIHNYIARDDDRTGTGTVHRMIKDTKTIGTAYDRYLQSGQLSSFASGEASTVGGIGLARGGGGGLPGHSLADPAVLGRHGGGGPDLAPNGRGVNYGGQLPVDAVSRPGPETVPLPPDASSTLYVEGLPSDSTRREVARIPFILMQCLGFSSSCFSFISRVTLILVLLFKFLDITLDIFRPFVGYREVRLVSKESKHRGGDPLILCFVDFANPACAATAMSALQGYKVDELNPESSHLRLQFSRYPGPRSGPASRGKR